MNELYDSFIRRARTTMAHFLDDNQTAEAMAMEALAMGILEKDPVTGEFKKTEGGSYVTCLTVEDMPENIDLQTFLFAIDGALQLLAAVDQTVIAAMHRSKAVNLAQGNFPGAPTLF